VSPTTSDEPGSLERTIRGIGHLRGATAVGFATVSRLPDLPSADPGYLLPGARSLVSVMVHHDPEIVARYLDGQDFEALQRHETRLYRTLEEVARAVARLLRRRGHEAVAAEPNLDYRFKRKPAYRRVPHGLRQALVDWLASDARPPLAGAKGRLARALYRGPMRVASWRLTPSFAHRYGAVAAGLGVPGWSGNVLHPDHGARVLFTTVLTSAELRSDGMLDEGLCDGCRLCARSCQSGYIDLREQDRVEIGGRTFVHNRKASNLRCILVCGGFTGQSRHRGWSTWSEGRVEVPEDDDALQRTWDELLRSRLGSRNHTTVNFANLVFHSEYGYVRKPEDRFETTCGFCQFVCAPTRSRRRGLYRAITGGAATDPDGTDRLAQEPADP